MSEMDGSNLDKQAAPPGDPAEGANLPVPAPAAVVPPADAAAPSVTPPVATAPVATAEPEPAATAPVATAEPVAAPAGAGDKRWYVVHTYSGYENKARKALEERIKREKLDSFFGRILIPTEEVVEMKRGKRRTSKRKFFPGYMLVEMTMNETSWYLVKSTPKITGFVGGSTRPPPIPEVEVLRLTSQIAEGAERVKPKVVFDKGDAVRVIDGPFANFNGVVDEIDAEKGKLRVLVSIFGRATPVEMDFTQVERT